MNESWIQKHERFLLVTLGAALLFVLFWNWLGKHYDVAKQQVSTDQAALSDQKKINQQLQEGYADLQKQTQQLNQVLQQQNQQLAAQTAAAVKAVAAQQAADAAMTNSQLAQRLGDLTNQKNLQSTTNGVDLTHDQSVGVTKTLEDIPTLKAQIQNDAGIVNNQNQEIIHLTDSNSSANLLITGLNKQLTDQETTCKAQISKLKIAGIKARLKWFGAGVVVGFIGKTFLHIP